MLDAKSARTGLKNTLGRLFPGTLGRTPSLSVLTHAQKRAFKEQGFLILPGFFAAETMHAVKRHLDHLWWTRGDQPRMVIDTYFSLPQAERTHFRKVPEEVRHFPYKLLDLHLDDEIIRDLSSAKRLMSVLNDLLGARPLLCNSLLFERGSQQDAHFDTFFMPSETPNMMAASWIAIDNVTDDNGPLYYYPKSHLIEPYRFSHGKINAIFSELKTGAAPHIDRIIAEHRLKREIFKPKQGDVLIWHAQLLHGGMPIHDPEATRCSLVSHYWTETDFPDAEQRVDLGQDRWLLKRNPMCVVDDESLAAVDEFLATLIITDAMREAVPESFDARLYLVRNQDILRAGANPWTHYAECGRTEGRIW